jgi:hypothetical protein
MWIRKFAAILFLSLCLCACGIAIPPEKSTYVGQWKAENMSLLITEHGYVQYQRSGKKGNVSIEGYLQNFDGNDFEVGLGPITTTFVVTQVPHQVNGTWKMVVDGVELSKIDDNPPLEA